MLVVLCVACCRITRDRPRSASFASAPYGAELQLLTSTLRAFTAITQHTQRRDAAYVDWVLPGEHVAYSVMTVGLLRCGLCEPRSQSGVDAHACAGPPQSCEGAARWFDFCTSQAQPEGAYAVSHHRAFKAVHACATTQHIIQSGHHGRLGCRETRRDWPSGC